MHNAKLSIALVVSFWASTSQALPPELIALIDERASDFNTIMSKVSDVQGRLILERWTNLMFKSPVTLGMKATNEELLKYLVDRFTKPHSEDVEMKKRVRPNYSEDAENMIKSLEHAFRGDFRGELLELNFECNKQNFKFPLEVRDSEGDVSLILRGVPVPTEPKQKETETRCLHITLNQEPSPSLLDRIGTLDTACPVPVEKAGECLLLFAVSIARATKRPNLEVVDGTNVLCGKNRERTSLRRLRFYQGRAPWYEKHRFEIDAVESEFKEAVKAFRTYPLADLKKDVAVTEKESERHLLFKELADEFDKHKQAPTLGNFMSWLWDKDCAKYTEIDRMIMNPDNLKLLSHYPTTNTYVKDLR